MLEHPVLNVNTAMDVGFSRRDGKTTCPIGLFERSVSLVANNNEITQ